MSIEQGTKGGFHESHLGRKLHYGRRVFLACHSTGNSFYDLPKGLQEENETAVEVCCRETREETGIELNPAELKDLGVFPYLRNKDLHLFLWLTEELPALDKLVCTSYFQHPRRGKGRLRWTATDTFPFPKRAPGWPKA
ncbi:NUDIX domain-containing protein [Paenibacillus sp. P25]|nr:NUDIX domain-containing protein [Paenibacillus sp. P25]